MHYIRFLKPPRLLSSQSPILSAKITITTDLGEAFLCEDIIVIVGLETSSGEKVLGSGQGLTYEWKGSNGMRSLEVSVPVPKSKRGEAVRVLIRPNGKDIEANDFANVLHATTNPEGEYVGQVMAVRSMDIDVRQQQGRDGGVKMAKRILGLGPHRVSVCEETGESIARHIWDAGVMLSAYLAAISPVSNIPMPPSSPLPDLPLLRRAVRQNSLNVLELGAGCGIVGITLSTFYPNTSQVLLTDLPEASEIITYNLSLLPAPSSRLVKHDVLDWSQPLSPKVNDTRWDLVLVADCTYNPSCVPELVSTLQSVARGGGQKANAATVVLLAMKVRHDSEMVCFDLLAEAGFVVREKSILPLPVLAMEAEEIEIYALTLEDIGGE